MKNLNNIILLGLIAVVGVFTLDVYLPGMPSMANEFNVSISEIAFTFTTFSIVFAITQIFNGMLSDYIGRKPVLLSGLFIAGVATLFCISAKTYESLLAARMVQAVGISVFVVVNAVIRDLYSGRQAIQIRTLVTTMSGISISIAPTVGALLQNKLDWQGGFIASFVLIVIAFLYALLFFRESNQNKTEIPFRLNTFIKSYSLLFTDKAFVLRVLQATLAYTVHFTFIIMSAHMFIDFLGYSPLTFGYLMLVYGGIYFGSGILTNYFVKKFSIANLIKLGSFFIGSGGLVMICTSYITVSAWNILIAMGWMTAGITLIRASAATDALASFQKQAGQAAAGLNLMQFMLSALIATCITGIVNSPAFILGLLSLTCAIVILVLNFVRPIFINEKSILIT